MIAKLLRVTRREMRFCRLLLIGWLCCGSAFAATVDIRAVREADKPDATTRSHSKRLREKFGIVLPESARVNRITKTPKSKVTYLFIKMSEGDGRLFKERLGDGPLPKRTQVSLEDVDCLKGPNPGDCIRIGAVNSPSDKPSDEIDQWFKQCEFQTDVIASFRIDGFKKFASMYLDSKKGLLLLWYKT